MITNHTPLLIDLVKSSEGCRLIAYQDTASIWTIGFGATFYQDSTKVKQGDIITQIQADNLLDFHLHNFDLQVSQCVTSQINQNQHDALTDFAYNCGIGNLKASTLLKKVNANPNDITIKDEFSKWVYDAKKNKLPGLITRRAKESELYFKVD